MGGFDTIQHTDQLSRATALFESSIPLGSLHDATVEDFRLFPLHPEFVSGDPSIIAEVLNNEGIDPLIVGEKLDALYAKSGRPVFSGEFEDQQNSEKKEFGAKWIKLLGQISEFTSTAMYLRRIQQGDLLKDIPSVLRRGNLSDEQMSLPFESRYGIRDNTLLLVGGYYGSRPEFANLEQKARRASELSQQRTRDDHDQDLEYITLKYEVEREYLLMLLAEK